jgi:hypothetical protein
VVDPVANNIPADLRNSVYYVGAAEGGETAWLFLYNRYKTTKVAAEATRCLVWHLLSQPIIRDMHRRIIMFALMMNNSVR